MSLSEQDLDELIALADRGAAAFGGNADWKWAQTALGRAIAELIGRTPTRLEAVTAARRHEERTGREDTQ